MLHNFIYQSFCFIVKKINKIVLRYCFIFLTFLLKSKSINNTSRYYIIYFLFKFTAIQPSEPGFLGDIFVTITCYLTFNFMAMLGNITASLWQFVSFFIWYRHLYVYYKLGFKKFKLNFIYVSYIDFLRFCWVLSF